MTEENISLEFRLKNIEKTRTYFIKEIDQNKLMSHKKKKVCVTLNYLEHFLTLIFAVAECIFISAFASLVGIMSSTIRLNICAIIAKIKNYKWIITKKKKKHDEIVFLAKTKLNWIKGWISRSLIDSYIGCDYFILIDGVLRKYDYMKK